MLKYAFRDPYKKNWYYEPKIQQLKMAEEEKQLCFSVSHVFALQYSQSKYNPFQLRSY